MTNRISAIPPEALQQISDGLDAVRAALEPHAVELSAEERQEVLKLSDRMLPFVEKSVRYADERPELVPGFLDADEMGADLKTYQALVGLIGRLRQLESLATDTSMVAGGEAHGAALVLYRAVRAAAKAGAPGADVVAADLGQQFARRSRPSGDGA